MKKHFCYQMFSIVLFLFYVYMLVYVQKKEEERTMATKVIKNADVYYVF